VGSRAHILIIDQDVTTLEALRVGLASDGFIIEAHADPAEAFRALGAGRFDVVVADIAVPPVEGLGVLERAQRYDAAVPVIFLAAPAAMATAADAVKQGAFDCIERPVRPAKLKALIERALEVRRLREEVVRLRAELSDDGCSGELIAHSPVMAHVVELMHLAAGTDGHVLIAGARGTGKQLVARTIHMLSRRAGKPFVAADCAVLARGQPESALFGHVRGAYPGAAADQRGLFEAADGGALFLNAVDELSKPAQLRLLKALDERLVRPLGSTAAQAVDVRLIAATTADLPAAVREQRFRKDLYERLSTTHIALPQLHERREDIPLLAYLFVKRTCARLGSDNITIGPETMQRLLAQPWPGNVAELRQIMERAVLIADGRQMRPEHLDDPAGPPGVGQEHNRETDAQRETADVPAAE
jgi:DNA-binding NtrC family response regulator